MTRKLSPSEKNHLLKHGISDFQIDSEIPVEYITGFAQFLNHDFIVDQSVLIPRIETEEIIRLVIAHVIKNQLTNVKIIDVGTGSGVVGITSFLELEKMGVESHITLVDVSAKALEITNQNLIRFRIPPSKIDVINSNLLVNIKDDEADIIVANLPYIPSIRIPQLEKSVTNYEPLLALDGGPLGLDLIYELLRQAEKKIKSNGVVILEIDEDHSSNDFSLFENDYKIEIIKDQFGKNRFLVATPKN